MKDIPVFTTDFGVASIILKEIPYRSLAYVRVQDVQPGALKELIGECVDFCRAAGAETVFATGHPELEGWPMHHSVLIMRGPAGLEPEGNLWPVTEETVSQWREIYNRSMKDVDSAASMTSFDEKEIMNSGGAYFVHTDAEVLGIGWVEEGKLLCVAAQKPGMGSRVLKTVLTAQGAESVELEVASTNERAIRLYEKMEFVKTGERSRWYQVL